MAHCLSSFMECFVFTYSYSYTFSIHISCITTIQIKATLIYMVINVALMCILVKHEISIEDEYIRRSEDKHSIKKDKQSTMIYKSQM